MSDKADYFEITKLFKVMDANDWREGKNFMKFWADGAAQIASGDPTAENKPTIGINVDKGLRIHSIKWNWLEGFSSARSKYKELFSRLNSPKVQNLLIRKYGNISSSNIISSFNDWLVDGLKPNLYLGYVKKHQLQRIDVRPYDTPIRYEWRKL